MYHPASRGRLVFVFPVTPSLCLRQRTMPKGAESFVSLRIMAKLCHSEAVSRSTDQTVETRFTSLAELERLPAAAFPGWTAMFFRP